MRSAPRVKFGFRRAMGVASSPDPVATFIARWSDTELAERAIKNLLINELCDVLDLLHPAPAGPDSTVNHGVHGLHGVEPC